MMKSLKAKIILLFFVSMVITTAGAYLLAYNLLFPDFMKKNIKNEQKRLAKCIYILNETGDYDLDGIISEIDDNRYNIEESQLNTKELVEYKDRLDNGEVIYIQGKHISEAKTLFKLSDEYILISIDINSKDVVDIFVTVIIAMIICIFVATLVTGFITNKIFHPIKEINLATEKIAKGQFDVVIKENGGENELEQLARSFNKMANELKGMETLRQDFVSNVSHEFKTPLASIQGFADLLQSDELDEEDRKEYTSIISEEVGRLSGLSANILRISKLENMNISIEKTEFNLAEQIRRVIVLLENKWSEKNIELVIKLDEVNFNGNKELLNQVWINLLMNAIKFTDNNGKITVALLEVKDFVVVKIRDNGIGMDEKTQKRIFEKFYQGDRSHSKQGNGLGLALVHRIIELSGGEIIVKSEVGEGTYVKVVLPNNYVRNRK